MQSSDERSRGSPATTEKDVLSGKKPRLEPPLDRQVNKEAAVDEATAAGDGGRGRLVVVPVESASKVKGTVKMDNMDMSLFECTLCSLPLKPPVFQCRGGHLACGGCRPGEGCRRCEHGGGFDVRSTAMDVFVSAARVECPHDGCLVDVVYHELSDHRSACPHAPCSCPEPSCVFVGLPPALVAHLTALHSVPLRKFQYGKDFRLKVPASEPSRRLLIGEDDDCTFLLSVGVLGMTTAVWVVCIRASAAPQPQYTCKIWSFLEPRPSLDLVMAKMKVTSSTSPGALVATSFLVVPPNYQVGDGPSKKVPLSVHIKRSKH